MAQGFTYTVTASTSIVRITALDTPNIVVLLSSISYPGHIVGIQDATGAPAITTQPIVVSTTQGIFFQDGTFSTLIQKPFGSLSLSSKTPTRWQLLNNTGFQTFLSNAFLSTLTASYAYVQSVSSYQEFVSTSLVGNLDVTNSIELGGTTEIIGDITVGGNVDFFSTMEVFQRLSLSSGLTVAGNFTSLSSVQIVGNLDVRRFLSTPYNLTVGDSLFVHQNVFADNALLSKNLSAQTLRVTTLNVGGELRVANDAFVQSNLRIQQNLVSFGSTNIQSSLTVGGTLSVEDSLFANSSLRAFTLLANSHASIAKEVYVQGSVLFSSIVSSFADVYIASTTRVLDQTTIGDNVFVNGLSRFRTLDVLGDVSISSLQALSSVSIQCNALSYGSTFVNTNELKIQGNLGIGGSLSAQTAFLYVSTSLSTFGNAGIGGSLAVSRDFVVGGDTTIGRSISGISSLQINGSVSTGFANVTGTFVGLGFLSVGKILGASTLGAPIDLNISTLFLSNTFYVSNEGVVPLLDTNQYPEKFVVGYGASNTSNTLTVEGVMNIRSTLNQTNYNDLTKLWYATEVAASTLSLTNVPSTAIIGPISDTKPLLQNYGAILTGLFPGQNDLFYSSNISTNYNNTLLEVFFSGGQKVLYNGSGRWVAVGSTITADTILTSSNGYDWTTAVSGGFTFGAYTVAYGSGLWLAGGEPGMGETSIQHSTDGSNWFNTIDSFNEYCSDIAYNGSNLWIAVGNFTMTPGIKYSENGISWSDATLIPPIPFDGTTVAYGDGKWFASDTSTGNYATSTDGVNWVLIGSFSANALQYNGLYWLAGSTATDNNPLTSIHLSPNGFAWIPILVGGFTGACTDVQWDSSNSLWWATGEMSPPTSNVLQYSADGFNWIPASFTRDIGRGAGIGFGIINAPDTANYLTFNRTTIFRSTVSSLAIYASTVRVSTITSDNFFGDGTGLSNVTDFRSTVFTSSILSDNAYALDISANLFRTEYMGVANSITVRENTFISSVNIWVATGADSEANGNVQTSFTGLNWQRGTGPTFEYYGRSVAGNCNASAPLYVATGADSRPLYTIQWSLDARNWFPITTGGFTVPEDGICQGNSVVYNTDLDIWVAAGNNKGTFSTLFYSLDARNWTCGNNGFLDAATFVTTSPVGFVALGPTGVKVSANGIDWIDSLTSARFTTVGYGRIEITPLTFNALLAVSNTTLYYSQDNGFTWQLTGSQSLEPIVSLVYGGLNWVAVGCNAIQYSSNASSWNFVETAFTPDTIFNAVAYNSNQARWVAGAVSTTADKSLWSSSNLQNWLPAQSGGFSTSVLTAGAGYGIFTSSLYTFAVGATSFNGVTETKQSILFVSTTGAGSYVTSNSLTLENTSNVFQNQVRGIFGSAEELYGYVAVGSGEVPQKTIARSLTGATGSWIPAITGGFSTTGYGVTYYVDRWIAVGDAQASTNTIQYSPDGANWFGANNTDALRQGGRGIGVGIGGSLVSTVVVVGNDRGRSTIAFSDDGYDWTPGIGSYFQGQGNGVAGGFDGTNYNFVAVGSDTRGSFSTILRSQTATQWSNVLTGGFTGGGFGVAYGDISGSRFYVAVGVDANSSNTIQYSSDGGANFNAVTSGAFTQGGYGVAFNPKSNLFFAVGEDIGALRSATIKYSGNAANWSNISSIAGFTSQTTLGAGYGVFSQGVLTVETIPYLEFPKLTIYERTDPLLYPRPTIRIQSSFMTLNESLYVNLSSQVIVSSNVPYSQNAVLTVYGDIYASSFIYTGPLLSTDTLVVSSLVVSTLSSFFTMQSAFLTTPSLSINSKESKPNSISSFADALFDEFSLSNIPTGILAINDVLFTTANMPTFQRTGINISTPAYDLDIHGSFGVSTFSTPYLYAPVVLYSSTSKGTNIQDPYFSFVSGAETDLVRASNSILTSPSSMVVNSIVSLNISSQKVGFYTKDPRFLLDVRSQTYLQALSTPLVNTSLLFLTLQSL